MSKEKVAQNFLRTIYSKLLITFSIHVLHRWSTTQQPAVDQTFHHPTSILSHVYECNIIDYDGLYQYYGRSKYVKIECMIYKQNRSTEGCSKLKRSVDMTSSGKNGLNIRTNASPKWDRTRCPEE